jgi:hypothetical protein
MPYEIVRVDHGYKVMNRINGKVFSMHPLPLKVAKKQMRALMEKYMEEQAKHPEMFRHEKHLQGAGIGDIFSKVKNVFTNDRSPAVDEIMKKYGFFNITGFAIHRTPVQKILQSVLNVVSLGKFKKSLEEKYDEVFHLFIVFRLQYGDGPDKFITYFLTEKTPNITVEQRKDFGSPHTKLEDIRIGTVTHPVTVKQMYDAAIKAQGPDFFRYNAYSNNCQVYIKNLLNAIGITEFDSFIYQPINGILEGFAKKFANVVTSTGHLVGRLTGSSIDGVTYNHDEYIHNHVRY